jgi:hypothetical protein
MRNPFKREIREDTYEFERKRLLDWLNNAEPDTDEYQKVMNRLNELDKMINRTSELKKTVIPALGTIGGVAGIYAIQQFAGVIVPKALESLAARQEQKKHKELD